MLGHSWSTQGLPFSLWDMWDLVLGRATWAPRVGARSLSHWTTSTDLLVFKDGFLSGSLSTADLKSLCPGTIFRKFLCHLTWFLQAACDMWNLLIYQIGASELERSIVTSLMLQKQTNKQTGFKCRALIFPQLLTCEVWLWFCMWRHFKEGIINPRWS